MNIKRVYASYFSATGTTEKMVKYIARKIASELDVCVETADFSLKEERRIPLNFLRESVVVMGTPVIAGRVPNVLLDFLRSMKGNEAFAIPIVMFGNRSFDNALIELRDLCESAGMRSIAAGGFGAEHSFSKILGRGRPDEEDFKDADLLISKACANLKSIDEKSEYELFVKGKGYPDYGGYYMPQDSKGNPIDIRKVKPYTDVELCTDCKLCYEICPMRSIDYEDVSKTPGICIKCCACIKLCPFDAKRFIDEGFIYHKEELEKKYSEERAENSIFYGLQKSKKNDMI